MKKLLIPALSLSAALAFAGAVPRVDTSSVTFTERAPNWVEISYTLSDAPCVVTIDIQTTRTGSATSVPADWVSIGARNFRSLAETVNRLEKRVGEKVTVRWRARKDWPDQKLGGVPIRADVKAWSMTAPPAYMVVDLTVKSNVTYYASADLVPGGAQADEYKLTKLLMRRIPATNARFRMGQWEENGNFWPNSMADRAVSVTLTNDYYMGVYELTQRQSYLVYGKCGNAYDPKDTAHTWYPTFLAKADDQETAPNWRRPAGVFNFSAARGDAYPRTAAGSWPGGGHTVGADSVCGKFRAWSGVDFDLPTEADWEFACRAGSPDECYNGGTLRDYNATTYATLDKIARYRGNGGYVDNGGTYEMPADDCGPENGSAIVGSYAPNAFGLYDMIGNYGELVCDLCLKDRRNIADQRIGPTMTEAEGGADKTSTGSVVRGGSWDSLPRYVRCGCRNSDIASGYVWSRAGIRLWAPCEAK